MQVYHSFTDEQDLIDQIDNFGYYLSLIVNCKMELDCRLAFKEKQVIITESENLFSNSTIKKSEEIEVCSYYKCNCNYINEVDEEFEKRYEEIKKLKKTIEFNSSNYDLYNSFSQTNLFDDLRNDTPIKSLYNYETKLTELACLLLTHGKNSKSTIDNELIKLLKKSDINSLTALRKYILKNSIYWYKQKFKNDNDLKLFDSTMQDISNLIIESELIVENEDFIMENADFIMEIADMFNIKK